MGQNIIDFVPKMGQDASDFVLKMGQATLILLQKWVKTEFSYNQLIYKLDDLLCTDSNRTS